jgi:hypothetical protein
MELAQPFSPPLYVNRQCGVYFCQSARSLLKNASYRSLTVTAQKKTAVDSEAVTEPRALASGNEKAFCSTLLSCSTRRKSW